MDDLKSIASSLIDGINSSMGIDFDKTLDENRNIVKNVSSATMSSIMKHIRTLSYIEVVCGYKEVLILDFSMGDFYQLSSTTLLLVLKKLTNEKTYKETKEYWKDILAVAYESDKSLLDKVVILLILFLENNMDVCSCVLSKLLYSQFNIYMTKV